MMRIYNGSKKRRLGSSKCGLPRIETCTHGDMHVVAIKEFLHLMVLFTSLVDAVHLR
jgi:hypothetical protein